VIMPDHPFRETKAWPMLRADAVRAVAALRAVPFEVRSAAGNTVSMSQAVQTTPAR